MKFLFKMTLFILVAIYSIYVFVGVETIIKYSGEIFFGGLIIIFIIGLIIQIKPDIVPMLEEKFVVFIFFIITFAISTIIAKNFDTEILNKKTFIVFNFDNTPRCVIIGDKEYIIKPFSHKRITIKAENIKVNNETIQENGKYLVNISKNHCYKLKHFFSETDDILINNPDFSSYYQPVLNKINYFPNDRFLVFRDEGFKYNTKDRDKYYIIIPSDCKWHIQKELNEFFYEDVYYSVYNVSKIDTIVVYRITNFYGLCLDIFKL